MYKEKIFRFIPREKMIKTYKYKLYQADSNRALHDLVNTACWVYNHCIKLHKRYYRLYKKH